MEKYDVAIVGSGACGGWACMALAQSGWKVALLEAGSHIEPYRDFHHRWPYELPFRGARRIGGALGDQSVRVSVLLFFSNVRLQVARVR